jgi:hypothetical protein
MFGNRAIKSGMMILVVHIASTGEMRNAHRNLVRKSEREKPLETPGRQWANNIKMFLKVILCKDMD